MLLLVNLAYQRHLARRLSFVASQHHRLMLFLPHCSFLSSLWWRCPISLTFAHWDSQGFDACTSSLFSWWSRSLNVIYIPGPILELQTHMSTCSHLHLCTCNIHLGLLDTKMLTAINWSTDQPLLTALSASQSLAIRNSILLDAEAKNLGFMFYSFLLALHNKSKSSSH